MSFLESDILEERSSAYTEDTFSEKPNRMVDQAAVVKPTVDYQDKLWTQIDILDDVKQMAQQAKEQIETGERSKSLKRLRQEQLAVLQRIQEQEQLMETTKNDEASFDRVFFTQLDEHFIKVEREMNAVDEQLKKLNK